jgi:hypothetical protein
VDGGRHNDVVATGRGGGGWRGNDGWEVKDERGGGTTFVFCCFSGLKTHPLRQAMKMGGWQVAEEVPQAQPSRGGKMRSDRATDYEFF